MRKGEKTRQELLKVAARLFRERGSQVSVDEVMGGLGLTRGGFYAHFGGKAGLFAESLETAFAEAKARFVEHGPGLGPGEWLRRANRRYLSLEHWSTPGRGCVLPSLATEVARGDANAQEAFTEGLRGILEGLTARTGRRDIALGALLSWVGAMTIARAINDPVLIAEIFAVAQARVDEDAARLP